MHQASVFINQEQYNKSNKLLTRIIKEAHHQGFIGNSLKEAFEVFQVKLNNKQLYLSNWVRRSIPNSYDAMTTSPVESINSHIKKRICASSLNNFSHSLMMIPDGMYKFAYMN
jgi:predicted transglutaminase-like protease